MTETIRHRLKQWYSRNKRDLPWRGINDPYVIWLSEIILQQTRIEQGTPYFLRFVARFPTVSSLASAGEDEVLKLWQGLGYYSRARNLHAASNQVMRDFYGKFPTKYDELKKLKGIGDYTAAAISSIVASEARAAIDGNVIRVISRLHGIEASIHEKSTFNQISQYASELLDIANPGDHNQMMMDFGSMQCTPKNPDCMNCILNEFCSAHRLGKVSSIPFNSSKVKRKSRHFHFLIATSNDQLYIEKRPEGDIWSGLYQFPLIEKSSSELVSNAEIESTIGAQVRGAMTVNSVKKHVLSHQDIFATFYHFAIEMGSDLKFSAIKMSDLHTFALPRLIDRYLELNNP